MSCCNILAPPTSSSLPFCPIDCSCITSSFVPTCYTVTGSDLCSHLIGINSAICNINSELNIFNNTLTQIETELLNIPCAHVFVSGITFGDLCPTLSSYFPTQPATLCSWLQGQINFDCNISQLITQGTGVNNNTGGNNGTFNNSVTTGVTVAGTALPTITGNVTKQHVLVANATSGSAKITATHNGNATISTVALSVVDPVYEVSCWVLLSAATAGNVTVYNTWNGTGSVEQITQLNTSGANLNKWYQIKTWFVPSATETVTFSVQMDGLTNTDVIYITDWVITPLTQHQNKGVMEPYAFQMFSDTNNASQYLHAPFVQTGGTITPTALNIKISDTQLIYEGKYFFGSGVTLAATDSTTNYIYYSTVFEGFKITQQAYGDDGDMLLWQAVASGGAITSTTQEFVGQPYNSNYFQPSGVTAATYGDATHSGAFTVNSQGLITSASSVAITFPVTSVNTFTGAVSLGLSNLNGVSLSSPANGDFLKYNGSNWVNSPGVFWAITGNGGTSAPTNFLGTTDAAPLCFKVNNIISGWLDYSPNQNTYFGYNIGNIPTATGISNTVMGNGAFVNNTTGNQNTAMGQGSLASNTTGQYNVAIGALALDSNTTGVSNIGIGRQANSSISTGNGNIAVGDNAGEIISSGSYNTFLGYASQASSGALTNSTAIGANATVSASNTVQLGGSGVVNVNIQGALSVPIYTSSLTSGTITVPQGSQALIITGAGGTTITINLPSSPVEGQIFYLTTSGGFTTPTLASEGNTFDNAPSSLTAHTGYKFIFYSSVWFNL